MAPFRTLCFNQPLISSVRRVGGALVQQRLMSPMRGFAAALLLWAVLAAPCAPHHRRGVCGASASVWLPALARQDDRPGCPSVADPAATGEAPPPRLRGLGVLRGGGAVGAGAEIRVPSESFPTLQDALDATCADDTCVVSRGCHSFGLPGGRPWALRSPLPPRA